MPFVDAAGVRVHYVEHGPPEGQAVVLLHGFTPEQPEPFAALVHERLNRVEEESS